MSVLVAKETFFFASEQTGADVTVRKGDSADSSSAVVRQFPDMFVEPSKPADAPAYARAGS